MKKFIESIISFIHLQLFITLLSLPILLAWGMPFSLLTFAGNFFFSPILTAFLLLSSLIFFCQVCHIPNAALIWILQPITHWWLKLMQCASSSTLLAFPLPHAVFLLMIPLSALAILHHKKINTPGASIAAYAGTLMLAFIYLSIHAPLHLHDTIACNQGMIHIIHHQNERILIDPGYIGQRQSAASWCEYTLMPALAKKYGANCIDHFVVLQPNRIIFDALIHLLEKMKIKNIYIPYWQGQMPKHWLFSFMKLQKCCSAHACTLIRYGAKPCLVNSSVVITPLDQKIPVQEFEYSAYAVTATIDNQSVSFYSAKHTPDKKKEIHEEKNFNDHRA